MRLVPHLGITLLVLALTSSVSAQEATPSGEGADDESGDEAGQTDDAEARAQALIGEAVAEYNAGRFREAYALFGRAHAIWPTARTLRGRGIAAFEMRNYARAMAELNAALASDVRPLTEAQRAHAEELVGRAERYVGQYRIRLTPETATVRVDGSAAELDEEGLLLLSLGTHELRVDCPECRPWSRRLVVEGGEHEEIVIDVAPSAEALEEPEPPRDETPAPVVVVQEEQPATPMGPIVLGGLGVVMIAAGVSLGLVGLTKGRELEEACPTRTGCAPELEGLQSDAKTFALVGDVLWVSGAVVLTGAFLWWLLSEGDESDDAPVAGVGCGLHGCSARLEVPLP